MAGAEGLLAGLAKEQLGLVIGIGVGSALAAALEPEVVGIRQAQFGANPGVAVDPEAAAAIVAEAVELISWGRGEAAQFGINADRFDALVGEALNAPPVGELLTMLRRGTINPDQFAHGLRKAKLEGMWDGPLEDLRRHRLEPATIAVAVQRGIMDNPGLLPVGAPEAVGRVPPMPRTDVDPVKEAEASGFDKERLAALTRLVGLPPGPGELLQLLNRRQIDEADFYRGIAEGNTRNEWAPFLLELRRRLLTPHEYIEARLRGWIDDEAMHAGAALSGMDADDADLLAKVTGRPISFRQVFIGARRGGHYDGPTDAIDPAFLKSLRESNIRPEWYSLAWAQRYTYPSAFVLRQLATSGELTAQEAEAILLYQGWEPTLARKVAARWAGALAGAGKEETKAELADEYQGGYLTEQEFRDGLAAIGYTGHTQDLLVHLGDARRVKRWREKLIDAIAGSYLGFKIDGTQARSELAEVNVTGEAAAMLVTLWDKQRRDTVRTLTRAELKKAYKRGLLDQAATLDALEHHGLTVTDAELYLAT